MLWNEIAGTLLHVTKGQKNGCQYVNHALVWIVLNYTGDIWLFLLCSTSQSCWTYGAPTKKWDPEVSLPVQVEDIAEFMEQISLPTPEGPYYRNVRILTSSAPPCLILDSHWININAFRDGPIIRTDFTVLTLSYPGNPYCKDCNRICMKYWTTP